MQIDIKHDESKQKFYAEINGTTARLEYKLWDNTIDFLSTYVPKEHRNKGIAAQLAITGLEFARENNFNVIPTCSYIDAFIERNIEYKGLVQNAS